MSCFFWNHLFTFPTLCNIAHFNQSLDESFKEKALKSFHVDDLIYGGHSVTDTHKFIQSKNHLAGAIFNLHKFNSNSPKLDQLVNGIESDIETLRFFGLNWNRLIDKMTFSFEHLRKLAIDTPTKRQLLTYMVYIYDPLGLLNSCIFLSTDFVVDRWCGFDDSTECIDIHGFCDASIKALSMSCHHLSQFHHFIVGLILP